MKLLGGKFDSIQGSLRGLYFRHYDKHLTTQVFSFIHGSQVSHHYLCFANEETEAQRDYHLICKVRK